MLQPTSNMQRVLLAAIVISGLFFFGAAPAAAQEDCKEAIIKALNKDLTGVDLTGAVLIEADLTDADLTDADLMGAFVSKSTTKGVDFNDWIARGGRVMD